MTSAEIQHRKASKEDAIELRNEAKALLKCAGNSSPPFPENLNVKGSHVSLGYKIDKLDSFKSF